MTTSVTLCSISALSLLFDVGNGFLASRRAFEVGDALIFWTATLFMVSNALPRVRCTANPSLKAYLGVDLVFNQILLLGVGKG